jgi:choline dehydrogenase-like flavoprotein
VLHVSCEAGQNEAALTAHGVEQAVAMLEAAGCEDVTPRTTAAPPGFGIHECGTARMGDDPQKSILNKWNQTHDIKNLFVMDGSSFVTISCVNPTLTMMALTVRACEYLIGELKRGNLA